MTSRQLQAQQTKKNIIATARRLFTEKDYDGVTISEIAKACGIGKGTLYHYFASKEELLMCLERETFQKMKQRVDLNSGSSWEERLKGFLLLWFEKVGDDDINYCRSWYRIVVDTQNEKIIDNLHIRFDMETIGSYLQEGVAQGDLKKDTPVKEIATDLMFSMYGASLYRCITSARFDLKEWAQTFMDTVVRLHMEPYLR